MNNIKAIEWIKNHLYDEGGITKQDRAMYLAILALEKQIPIIPDFIDECYDDAYCPKCKKFEFEYGTSTWELPYCPNCGQALSWDILYMGDYND